MMELRDSLAELRQRFIADANAAADEQALDLVRIAYLGRNGEVTRVRRTIGTLSAHDRPGAGKAINDAVAAMEAHLNELRSRLETQEFE